MYKEEEVLRAQVDILTKTKLVDFAMDKYKQLHGVEEAPAGKPLSVSAGQKEKKKK